MATTAQWIEGARPRTLPNAIAPVLVGTGAAVSLDGGVWWKALLALIVSLALIVGVNFANDYSDGIRGTDDERVGPLRLVGSGVAGPASVKRAAFACFGVAAVAGLVLAATTAWWLVAVGAIALAAAWFYTGGSSPYGYRGLGEVSVFIFFGLVAVMGTAYVQMEEFSLAALWLGCGIGSLACALLVANNLRDIPTDEVAGKRTLAVRMGDARTRELFSSLHGAAFAFLVVAGLAIDTWWILGALISLPLSIRAQAVVRSRATGPALIPALRMTGVVELLYAIGVFFGLLFAAGS